MSERISRCFKCFSLFGMLIPTNGSHPQHNDENSPLLLQSQSSSVADPSHRPSRNKQQNTVNQLAGASSAHHPKQMTQSPFCDRFAISSGHTAFPPKTDDDPELLNLMKKSGVPVTQSEVERPCSLSASQRSVLNKLSQRPHYQNIPLLSQSQSNSVVHSSSLLPRMSSSAARHLNQGQMTRHQTCDQLAVSFNQPLELSKHSRVSVIQYAAKPPRLLQVSESKTLSEGTLGTLFPLDLRTSSKLASTTVDCTAPRTLPLKLPDQLPSPRLSPAVALQSANNDSIQSPSCHPSSTVSQANDHPTNPTAKRSGCSQTLSGVLDLNRDSCIEQNQEARPYNCTICLKKFKTKPVLRQHQTVHQEARLYNCPICNKIFKRAQHLSQHQITHQETLPYECSICRKEFKAKRYLSQHQTTHQETLPYECSICQKKFKRSYELRQHEFAHQDAQLHCNQCEKVFKQKRSLVRHMNQHHPVSLRC